LEREGGVSELNGTQDYSKRVGERIRAIRRQKRLSLQEVEAASSQEFKASVLGAYERGERAISVPRLQRLSRFYNVPADQLLPADAGPSFGVITGDEGAVGLDDRAGRPAVDPITIDLTELASLSGPEAEMLTQYLTTIQVQRQDFNGRVLTVREQDRLALAAILGTGLDGVATRLEALGLNYRP
jgi:transcriptional regulator with XRE-family HTH domain